MVCCSLPPAARDDAVDGQSGKEEVPGRLRDRAAAFRETLRILALVVAVEESLSEPPERVAGEAEREQDQEAAAERLLRDRRQGAVLVWALLAAAERDLDGEDADDGVEDALGGEPDSAEPFHPRALPRAAPLRCDRPVLIASCVRCARAKRRRRPAALAATTRACAAQS